MNKIQNNKYVRFGRKYEMLLDALRGRGERIEW